MLLAEKGKNGSIFPSQPEKLKLGKNPVHQPAALHCAHSWTPSHRQYYST